MLGRHFNKNIASSSSSQIAFILRDRHIYETGFNLFTNLLHRIHRVNFIVDGSVYANCKYKL